jgi:lipid-binding SYLF domain-containing protein
MRRFVAAILLAGVLAAKDDVALRLDGAASLFEAAKHGIPAAVLEQARCVALIPGLKKTGLVAAGSSGRGFAVCRQGQGWSAPAAMQVAGKSLGLQAGRSERDVVLLVTTDAGVKHLVSNKFEVPARSPVAEAVC